MQTHDWGNQTYTFFPEKNLKNKRDRPEAVEKMDEGNPIEVTVEENAEESDLNCNTYVPTQHRAARRGAQIWTLDKEVGEDKWRVYACIVLPRLVKPKKGETHQATPKFHARVCLAEDHNNIFNVPYDNIDFNRKASDERCRISNNEPAELEKEGAPVEYEKLRAEQILLNRQELARLAFKKL